MVQRNVLYRVYDAAGVLLYIGATTNPGGRLNDHAKLQPWWDDATVIKLEHLPSWQELVEAGRAAIQIEGPRYNVINSDKPTPWNRKPRSRRGEGRVYRRADGMWCGAVDVQSPDGKRKRKVVSSRDRMTAQLKLNQLRAELGR